MKNVPLDLLQADAKRMTLAFEHDTFGLPDPTERAKAAGFAFGHAQHNDNFSISYKGASVANFWSGHRLGQQFYVSEDLGGAAVIALVNLVHRIRDTARRADSILKADARRMKAQLAEFLDTARPAQEAPFSHQDAFAIHATDGLRKPAVRIRLLDRSGGGRDGFYDTYRVDMASELSDRNTMRVHHAFRVRGGRLGAQNLKVSADALGVLAETCAELYRTEVAALDLPEEDAFIALTAEETPEFHDDTPRPLTEMPGFSVHPRYGSFEVVRDADGLVLARTEMAGFLPAHPHFDTDREPLSGPGLTKGQVIHICNQGMRGLLRTDAALRAAEQAEGKLTEEQAIREAAAVLGDLDIGYQF